jgi:hypothetical protein
LAVGLALAGVLTTGGAPETDVGPDGDGDTPVDSPDDAEADGDPSGCARAGSTVP